MIEESIGPSSFPREPATGLPAGSCRRRTVAAEAGTGCSTCTPSWNCGPGPAAEADPTGYRAPPADRTAVHPGDTCRAAAAWVPAAHKRQARTAAASPVRCQPGWRPRDWHCPLGRSPARTDRLPVRRPTGRGPARPIGTGPLPGSARIATTNSPDDLCCALSSLGRIGRPSTMVILGLNLRYKRLFRHSRSSCPWKRHPARKVYLSPRNHQWQKIISILPEVPILRQLAIYSCKALQELGLKSAMGPAFHVRIANI